MDHAEAASAFPPPRPLRILVVEDDVVAGLSIVSVLEDLGLEVIGPVPAMAVGTMLADSERLDAALLDVRLGDGDTSFPVAATLAQRGVPFGFLSGYGRDQLPLAFLDRPLIGKPVLAPALLGFVEQLLGGPLVPATLSPTAP